MTIRTVTYTTGRDYGTPQVLTITLTHGAFDDNGAAIGEVVFDDPARHIKGRMSFLTFEGDTNTDIGRSVLALYDAGQYFTI